MSSHVEVARRRTDIAIACAIAVAAAWLGTSVVRSARHAGRLPPAIGLEQQVFGVAAMHVCGRGYATPLLPLDASAAVPSTLRPMAEFLARMRETLSCADIPGDVPTTTLAAMQRSSLYLTMLVEVPWRLSSQLSWAAMDWLFGALFAASIGLTYVTCRVLMGRLAALLVTLAFMLSPLHLTNLIDLRDYSKAPFFVATMLFLALVATWRRPMVGAVALSAVAGIALGFGYGMRTDVALNVGVIVVAIALFFPAPVRASWKLRGAAIAVLVAAFAVVSAPVPASRDVGGAWHWALLGFGHDFDTALGVAPGPYETGYFYDDSYAASIADAYWGRTTHASDQAAGDVPSRGYYLQTVASFPADTVLRAWASVVKVLGLPFSHRAATRTAIDLVPGFVRPLVTLRNRVLDPLSRVGVPLFAIVLLAAAVRDMRLAAAVFAVVVALGGYPAVQFHERHFFHLELVSLLMLGIVCSSLAVWFGDRSMLAASIIGDRRSGTVVGRLALVVAVVVAVVVVPLALLRLYQQRTAAALLTSYEGARVVDVPLSDEPAGEGNVRVADAAAVLPAYTHARSMRSEQVVVETANDACEADHVTVTFKYAETPARFDYSRTFDVPVLHAREATRLFFTVYESGASSPPPHHFVFEGIEVPASQRPCIGRVARFADPDAFPLLIPAVLVPGWRTLPLHQTLNRLERPWRARIHAGEGVL